MGVSKGSKRKAAGGASGSAKKSQISNLKESELDSSAGGSSIVSRVSTPVTQNSGFTFKKSGYKHPSEGPKKKPWKNLKQILQAEPTYPFEQQVPTFTNIEAPPSLLPRKKYCDISGLIAPYMDPKTKLRYHDSVHYKAIKTLPEDIVEGYLTLRGDNVVLK
eukprot:Nk52_evm70s343 gene=Nk52_evmTU70s343